MDFPLSKRRDDLNRRRRVSLVDVVMGPRMRYLMGMGLHELSPLHG
jgi:hypothetical protein